ncbi:MAG: hypothetical protein IPM59_00350 [Chloracidobacterium sp.]|nr:hypothetical protein [Chloracidobacterium sp.]
MKHHSLLGQASCLIALAIWVYFGAAFYLVFYLDGTNRVLADLFIAESRGMTDLSGMGMAIVIYTVIFFFIPVIGHLVGLILGVIGLLSRSRTNLFPGLGIALNLLPVFILSALYLIGSLAAG